MTPKLLSVGPGSHPSGCPPMASAEALNRDCHRCGVDPHTLHQALVSVMGAHGLPQALAQSHPHLYSALPVYVSRGHLQQIQRVASAIEEITASDTYRSAVLAWAPDIARFDPGSPGGLLGLDFHLGAGGPRLIEINTNPGGVLLNALLAQAQQLCLPERMAPPIDPAQVECAVLQVTRDEWHLQRGGAPLQSIAIVDEAPTEQFLYPEFLMFRELFRRAGYRAHICGPGALVHRQNRLWLDGEPVDFVYNRLTDFDLQQPAHLALRTAYLASDAVVSPHPRAHALYADKRNLCLLGDRQFLQSCGAGPESIEVLATAVPATCRVTPDNRASLWAARRTLFFKPAAGFGSRGSYRGDKLTRRVWEEIAGGTYVAQDIVSPSERHLAAGSAPLKLDLRCYAYRGEVLLHAARMYQGQTTNFRTPGGGFAPVLADVEA